MKIFLYKFAIILFGIFLLFELMIGSKIKHYERDFRKLISTSTIDYVKSKIRQEMKSAISKERYLDKEDSELIGQFLLKIQKEIIVEDSN
jgi:hypothetical protein